MRASAEGHKMYLNLSIGNFVEACIGGVLATKYTNWTLFALIAHSVVGTMIAITSPWIWFSYEMGTHISPYPFGPKEPYLSTFYTGV